MLVDDSSRSAPDIVLWRTRLCFGQHFENSQHDNRRLVAEIMDGSDFVIVFFALQEIFFFEIARKWQFYHPNWGKSRSDVILLSQKKQYILS